MAYQSCKIECVRKAGFVKFRHMCTTKNRNLLSICTNYLLLKFSVVQKFVYLLIHIPGVCKKKIMDSFSDIGINLVRMVSLYIFIRW